MARDAVVEESILFDGASVGRGAEIRRASLDDGVQVRPGAQIAFDLEEDRGRTLVVSDGGITIMPTDTVVEAG